MIAELDQVKQQHAHKPKRYRDAAVVHAAVAKLGPLQQSELAALLEMDPGTVQKACAADDRILNTAEKGEPLWELDGELAGENGHVDDHDEQLDTDVDQDDEVQQPEDSGPLQHSHRLPQPWHCDIIENCEFKQDWWPAIVTHVRRTHGLDVERHDGHVLVVGQADTDDHLDDLDDVLEAQTAADEQDAQKWDLPEPVQVEVADEDPAADAQPGLSAMTVEVEVTVDHLVDHLLEQLPVNHDAAYLVCLALEAYQGEHSPLEACLEWIRESSGGQV